MGLVETKLAIIPGAGMEFFFHNYVTVLYEFFCYAPSLVHCPEAGQF